MVKENVQIYFGEGKGKTTTALGLCIKEAGLGKQVIIVQFLKGKDTEEISFIKRLEPEIKLFRFEKTDKCYIELTQEEKQEQEKNIQNGLNYVRKVIDTRGCDVLVLDEILGLVDNNIITVDDIKKLLLIRESDMEFILTGRSLPEELKEYAAYIYNVSTIIEP